jgi:response regulator of citrate/malate metabolism
MMTEKLAHTMYASFNRIVLVDDDALTNMLNRKVIQSINPDIPVEIFLDIDDALEFLKEKDKEGRCLILLDINFPGKNGWDFLDAYQQFEKPSKIIMLSSSIDTGDQRKAKSHPLVLDYVTKPLSFDFIESIFPR